MASPLSNWQNCARARKTLQTQRGRMHSAGCVRQWFRTTEPLGERRYENWNIHLTCQTRKWIFPQNSPTLMHNAKEDKNRKILRSSRKTVKKKPAQIQQIKRQEREIATRTIFFVSSAPATFVYNATLATRMIRRFPIKNIHYLNQSSLLAIPVSQIRRRSVYSVGNQGHHFWKIGESKTESTL